jgi:hypothetical protein
MRSTTNANWTEPGADSFNQKLADTAPDGACVYCGDYDPEFREHFMTHFAANGGEYGRYSDAYHFGHEAAHRNRDSDWDAVERQMKDDWDRRGQGPWEDFKDAVRFGWHRVSGKK